MKEITLRSGKRAQIELIDGRIYVDVVSGSNYRVTVKVPGKVRSISDGYSNGEIYKMQYISTHATLEISIWEGNGTVYIQKFSPRTGKVIWSEFVSGGDLSEDY